LNVRPGCPIPDLEERDRRGVFVGAPQMKIPPQSTQWYEQNGSKLTQMLPNDISGDPE